MSTVLVARQLGPAGRGTYALPVIASLVTITLVVGVQYASAFHVSNPKIDVRWLTQRAMAIGLLCGTLIGGTLAAALLLRRSGGEWLWWAAFAQPAVGLATTLTGIPLGQGKVALFNLLSAFGPVTTCLGCLALVIAGDHEVSAFLTVWVASQWIAAFSTSVAVRHELRSPRIEGSVPAPHFLRFAVQGSLYKFADFFNYRFDFLIVAMLRSRADLGLYSIAVQMADILFVVGQSVIIAIYGRVGSDEPADAAALTARVFRHLGLIMVIIGLIFLLGIGVVVGTAFGKAYLPVVPTARIVILGAAVGATTNVLLTYFVNSAGRPAIPLVIASVAAAVNVALCLALVPILGILGAAIASCLSYLAQALALIRMFTTTTGLRRRRSLIIHKADLDDYRTVGAIVAKRLLRGL